MLQPFTLLCEFAFETSDSCQKVTNEKNKYRFIDSQRMQRTFFFVVFFKVTQSLKKTNQQKKNKHRAAEPVALINEVPFFFFRKQTSYVVGGQMENIHAHNSSSLK